jgi:hypothetical protein
MQCKQTFGTCKYFLYNVTNAFGPSGKCHNHCELAPASGAAAAAREGGALAGPSASPHLSVAGVGNPVAVPCLVRGG